MTLAWPPGGTADLSVLTNLATAEHVGTVVLNSSEMPPANAATVFQPDDAVTSLRVAGLPMNVLLSDNTLTGVLKAGDTSSGTLPKSTEFAVRQRFLAETAMIAAEAPDSARTIVVAPPEDWSPSAGAGQRPARRDHERPVADADPAGQPELGAGHPARGAPAAAAGQQGEPGRAQPRLPGPGAHARRRARPCTSPCSTSPAGLPAGPGRGPDRHRVGGLARRRGGAGPGAGRQPVPLPRGARRRRSRSSRRPRYRWAAPPGWSPCRSRTGCCIRPSRSGWSPAWSTAHRTSQLTVGHFQNADHPAPAGGDRAAAGQLGPAGIHRHPAQPDQRERNAAAVRSRQSLTVPSTRYGRAILFLIGAAIGVLVLTSVFRGIRRWLHGDTHLSTKRRTHRVAS